MPPWGRPSGASRWKRENRGDRYARHREEEDRRFEEIDSDEDDGQGVGLNVSHVSDKLYFTGADMGSRRWNPRNHDDDRSSEPSGEDDYIDERSGGTMQLVLRDKEEKLVQKALERIRRAQKLGKSNVKLTQLEIDALERRRRKDHAVNSVTGSRVKVYDRRHGSDQSIGGVNDQKPGKRKSSAPTPALDDRGSSSPKRGTPPGIVVPGPDGNLVHSGFGQYPAPGVGSFGRSSRSGSRSAGSHSQQQHTPPLPTSQFRPAQTRYFSGSDSSRPSSKPQTPPLPRRLPDDPGWIPRPRSASSNPSYSAESFQHHAHSPPLPPMPLQHNQGRRNASGPPEVQYTGARRGPPTARAYATSSQTSLLQRDHSYGVTPEHRDYADYSDDEDDGNYGVQVELAPYDQSYESSNRPEDYGGGRSRRGER